MSPLGNWIGTRYASPDAGYDASFDDRDIDEEVGTRDDSNKEGEDLMEVQQKEASRTRELWKRKAQS